MQMYTTGCQVQLAVLGTPAALADATLVAADASFWSDVELESQSHS